MDPGNLVGLLLLVTAGGAGLLAMSVLCTALFPRLVERARHNAEQLPRRAFAVGLVNFLFFSLLAVGLSSGDQGGQLLGLLVLTVLLAFVAMGLSAVALLVGERLGLGAAPRPLRALAGMAVVVLAALTPVVGWFGVSSLAGLLGYGALIIALFQRSRGPAPPEPLDRPD